MPSFPGRRSLTAAVVLACSTPLFSLSTAAAPNGAPFADLEQSLQALESQVDGLSATLNQHLAGNPLAELEQSLQALDAQVDALSDALNNHVSAAMPVDVSVDCGAGEQISAVLAQYQYHQYPLSIAVSGSCNESVLITRDDVSLKAAEPGASIISPTGLGAVTVTRGADNAYVEGLTLVGNEYGAVAARGAQVWFNQVDVTATGTAVLSVDNAIADVSGSTIHDSNSGISAVRGAVAKVDSTVFQQNNTSLFAASQGIVQTTDSLPDTTPSIGVTITQSGGAAVYARNGGQISMSAAQVHGAGFALYASSGGVIELNRDNLVSGNSIGIEALADTSIGVIGSNNRVLGNSTGIRCVGDANYFFGSDGSLDVLSNGISNNGCLL